MQEMDERALRHARAALAALKSVPPDGVMSAKRTLAEALDELVKMRDELVRSSRGGHDCSGALCRTNAIISSVFGTEYPSGAFQWKRVEGAQQALQCFLDECSPASARDEAGGS